MLIQYASDLHLEFPKNKAYLQENPIIPTGDVLILAGDIVPFLHLPLHKGFFDWLSENFLQTYWLPGNHEYYYSDIKERTGSFKENIRKNVHLVNNWTEEIDGNKYVFTTLWSRISPLRYRDFQRGMADYHHIKNHGEYLTTDNSNALHNTCFDFLQSACREDFPGKTIVVTHHVPTLMNYPEEYRGSILNEGFAVELFDFIQGSTIDKWIFGHHHRNIPAFSIGGCELVTNQLGYIDGNEHAGFSTGKCLSF